MNLDQRIEVVRRMAESIRKNKTAMIVLWIISIFGCLVVIWLLGGIVHDLQSLRIIFDG